MFKEYLNSTVVAPDLVRFGVSLAVAVGTRLKRITVHIFERNETLGRVEFKFKVTASDGAAGDRFGRGRADYGAVLAVGAFGDDKAAAQSTYLS